MEMRKVNFDTSDGVTIFADFYTAKEPGGPSALLLHMMPATKESWRKFAMELIDRGFANVLAIDLRGHGESIQQGEKKLDYIDFEDTQHQLKMRDVEAAVAWLEGLGIGKDRLLVAGASIGANLSIVYGSEHQEIPAVVALSPGLNYRGVTTLDKMPGYDGRELYLAASEEDGHSFETNKQLHAAASSSTLKELSNAGHGTTMFEKADGFMSEVVEWVVERVK
jgi:pimeloyl-ACP methyl ester carboxylesterase